MPRLVHFTLADGRSIVAAFDDTAEQFVGDSAKLMFVADDGAELLPLNSVRECHEYHAREPLPPRTRVFNFAVAR